MPPASRYLSDLDTSLGRRTSKDIIHDLVQISQGKFCVRDNIYV